MNRKIAQRRLELLVDSIWVVFAGWYLITTQTYPPVDRLVPTVFSGVALAAGIFQWIGNFVPGLHGLTKGFARGEASAPGEGEVAQTISEKMTPSPLENRRQLIAIVWAMALFAGILVLGFLIALPLFMLVYFLTLNRRGWVLAVSGAVGMGVITYFVNMFSVPLPTGLLFKLFG